MTDEKIQDFLRDLAERLLTVPMMYGVEGADIGRLHDAANKVDDLERESGKLAGRV